MKDKKKLLERRNTLKRQMSDILSKAKKEERALTPDEVKAFDSAEAECRSIKAELKTIKEREDTEMSKDKNLRRREWRSLSATEQQDYSKFAKFIRGAISKRNDVNLTVGANGAIIPSTIVNEIIKKVEDVSPAYQLASHYTAKGSLIIPVKDTSSTAITVGLADEFSTIESTSHSYTSITLSEHLFAALTKVSKSLINNSDFDVVNEIVDDMGEAIAVWLDDVFFNGKSKSGSVVIKGVSNSYDSTNMKVTLASKDAITADELVDLQELVPDVYQANAIWVMNKATRTAIRKLKDLDGNYILQRDANARWGYTLFGQDVFTSSSVTALGTNSKNVVYYGDMSGVAVRETTSLEIQVLDQNYATEHCVGVLAWGDTDVQVKNTQKIAVAVTPAAAAGGSGTS